MSDHDDARDLDELDARARAAAEGLQHHVARHLDVEASLEDLPSAGHRRTRGRILTIAAAAALLVGTIAVVDRSDGDRTRVDVDVDQTLPDADPTMLRPLGPQDGKDSIRLPLTAEPSTGLHDGDLVTVRGEGFVPGESVGLVQCAREAGGPTPEVRGGVDGCNISNYTDVTADADGVATGTYAVHRVLTTPMTGTVDCAAEAERCIVAMGAISDYDRSGGKAITFATDVPPVDIPSVEVTPTEGLSHGDLVHVRGSGLTPGEAVYLEVCSSDPLACWQTGDVIDAPVDDEMRAAGERGTMQTIGLLVDGNGELEGDVPVWRFLVGAEPGTYVDCAVSRCSLRLNSTTAPPAVPLHFAPEGEGPTAPGLVVSQTSGLAPGDRILVGGSGLGPSSTVGIVLCGAPSEGPEEGYQICGNVIEARTDEDGHFELEYEVPDLASYEQGYGECTDAGCTTYEDPPDISCDGASSTCWLTVERWEEWDGTEVLGPTFTPVPVPISFR